MATSARRRNRAIGFGIALFATGALAGTASGGRFVEYLHVEAGSGSSGGGHAALRIGDTTYHYVYAEPGLIKSTAESNASFDYAYRALGNRSIHVSRIAVPDELYRALADNFARRHITQQAQLGLLDRAEDDQALLAHLYEGRCRHAAEGARALAPRLRGAGYFEGGAGPVAAATGPAGSTLAALRMEIERTHGAGYLALKSRTIKREIRTLAPVPAQTPRVAQWQMPVQEDGFAARYRALATTALAIDVLLDERAPSPSAYRILGDPVGQLSGAELALLTARARELRFSLVRLAASARRDWGYPMLVGMARLVALNASLRSGHLVVPDSFDDAAVSMPVAKLLAEPPVAMALLLERRDEFDAARAALRAAPPEDEAAWSRLELAASALLELGEAVQRGEGFVRAYPETMLPSRSSGPDATWTLPDADCATLAQWTDSARQAAESLRDRLRDVYGYDVVSRNCVTEIFRTMEGAGATFGAGRQADAGLGFMPFVSAAAVNDSYPVTARDTLPSYRTYWLARLRDTQGRVRTALRESNTITATLRHPDDRDDVFVFYTEDATVLRPLYGAINAGVGAGAMVAGLVTLLFDRGRLLTTGARSFAFSLPELAFMSVRKGRNGMLPHAWMDVPQYSAVSLPAPATVAGPSIR